MYFQRWVRKLLHVAGTMHGVLIKGDVLISEGLDCSIEMILLAYWPLV